MDTINSFVINFSSTTVFSMLGMLALFYAGCLLISRFISLKLYGLLIIALLSLVPVVVYLVFTGLLMLGYDTAMSYFEDNGKVASIALLGSLLWLPVGLISLAISFRIFSNYMYSDEKESLE